MQINVVQILLQIVNFAILLFLLTKFLYRPILKIMEARSKKIQEGLEAAEKSLEDQAKSAEKRQQMLIKAEADASVILDKSRVEAKQAAKDIITVAKKEAREAIEKEYKIIQAKLEAEEQKAKRNIANLVTATTEAVLQSALSSAAHKQIIKKQINELGKLKN